MRFRKKYSLAIFFSITSFIMVLNNISSEVLTAYGIIATGVLGAFGASDVFDNKFKGD